MSEKLTPEVAAVIAAMIHRQAMGGFKQVLAAKLRGFPPIKPGEGPRGGVCSSPKWKANLR